MASAFETRLGELAIARGLVSLDDLLQCIQQSHGSGASLCDAIVDRGLASRDEIDGLCRELDERSHEELAPEFEAGETAALESFEIPSTDTAVAQVEQADTLDRPNSSTGSAPTFQLGESPEDAPTDDELSIANFPERDERYEIESELGAGGMGRVLLARDRVMNREIALKAVRRDLGSRENARKRLIHEARLTGLLEHPSIVPTYELARTPNGEPFYTMRVVREKSLEQILDEIREEDPTDADNPPTRLVSFLRQVALALHYAHDRQVIHRDIKPANILIGAYGEVFIIDWGVAKVLSEDLTSYSLDALLDLDEGAILGTPWYMAPEQAEGSDQQIDRRTDVYSLGAVLYEILTLTPVFRTEKTVSLVFKVLTEAPEPPSERAPDRAIPRELEQICMKALAKNPDERFDSAQAFADELEMFLEGVKERERRRAMAVEVTGEAQKARRNYHRVRDRLRELRRELDRKRLELPATASMDDKEELWELEQRVDDLQVEVERAFGRATRLYDQALGHQPDMERARRALADLYWERFREYEARGERARAAYFEGLVRRYNDGQYDDLLEGMATVHLETSPAGADAELCRYEEVNHRLVEKRIERAGPTPTEPLRVEHGSYVFEVDLDGHVPVNVPVRLERLDERNLDVELYRSGEIPEDFVVVPGGPFLSGEVRFGEPERDEEYLPDYAIKRHPVTCREYLDFLNALAAGGDLNAAKQHAPRQPDGPSYFPLEEGRFRIPEEDRDGDAWDPDWPICMINFHSAQAYADWRSTRDDRTYRLPTAEEWEKAARGVDGRTYPWGDNFDPSFCHMQDSREGRPMPAPVGSYAIDRSPYGAMDMAGNVSEWTSTTPSGSPSWRVVQGASFASVDLMCRLDWNMQAEADQRKTLFGFRLVTPLDED